jgi:hypothetical protein
LRRIASRLTRQFTTAVVRSVMEPRQSPPAAAPRGA